MCLCQGCGKAYKVDLIVPNEIWKQIKPRGSSADGGLLCPSCIGARLEALGGYRAFHFIKV